MKINLASMALWNQAWLSARYFHFDNTAYCLQEFVRTFLRYQFGR